VVNLDKSSRPGSHWVAMHFPNEEEARYFDSYGQPPPMGPIRDFLRQFKKIEFHPFVIQSLISNVCAAYCIYFIHQCARGKSYESILTYLERHSSPDVFVKKFMNEIVNPH
jgi:hypothetical protein